MLTRQVAQFPLVNIRNNVGREETLGHVPQQTNRSRTLASNAQLCSVIAFSLVVARFRFRALGRCTIARGTPGALGLFPALDILVRLVERATVVSAARSLAGTALGSLPPRTSTGCRIQTQVILIDLSWITALVQTLFVIKATVTLFAALYDLITAERTLGRLEAVAFLVVLDRVQHIRNVPN